MSIQEPEAYKTLSDEYSALFGVGGKESLRLQFDFSPDYWPQFAEHSVAEHRSEPEILLSKVERAKEVVAALGILAANDIRVTKMQRGRMGDEIMRIEPAELSVHTGFVDALSVYAKEVQKPQENTDAEMLRYWVSMGATYVRPERWMDAELWESVPDHLLKPAKFSDERRPVGITDFRTGDFLRLLSDQYVNAKALESPDQSS